MVGEAGYIESLFASLEEHAVSKNKWKKVISKTTQEFSASLMADLQLENYPAIIDKIQKIKRKSGSFIQLTLLIPTPEEFTDAYIEAINYYESRFPDGKELLVIPSRRWYMRLAQTAPEALAKQMIKVIQEAVGTMNGKKESQYIS